VVKWLLFLNIGIFALDYLVLSEMIGMRGGDPPLMRFGAFSIGSAFGEHRLWELITFQFLHASVGHVAFNCLGLYFFGPWMERWWGSGRFLLFYLLCGCAGAGFFTLLALMQVIPGGMESGLVGASAGIYGILIGVAVIAPNLRVTLLIPPVELSMRQLALWLMAISVVMVLFGLGGNEGGEAGHLGGAILGFILVRFPQLLGMESNLSQTMSSGPVPENSKLRPRSHLHLQEDPEVDSILDKISSEGFQSLTQNERDILRAAAERQQSSS
jgi:membrane associated rhomboid family serine protease